MKITISQLRKMISESVDQKMQEGFFGDLADKASQAITSWPSLVKKIMADPEVARDAANITREVHAYALGPTNPGYSVQQKQERVKVINAIAAGSLSGLELFQAQMVALGQDWTVVMGSIINDMNSVKTLTPAEKDAIQKNGKSFMAALSDYVKPQLVKAAKEALVSWPPQDEVVKTEGIISRLITPKESGPVSNQAKKVRSQTR